MTRRAAVPALEPVPSWKVVATADAIDRAEWVGDDVDVVRIAPDEALGIGAIGVVIDDPHAISEPESGFVVALLTESDLAALAAHVEWTVPATAGSLAQGKIGGVPAKLVVGSATFLITQAAYADELRERLGW
jgi:hypothetical protein